MMQDYQPLRSLVTKNDIADLKLHLYGTDKQIFSFGKLIKILLLMYLFFCFLPIVSGIFQAIFSANEILSQIMPPILTTSLVALSAYLYLKYDINKWIKRVRLHRFAQVNGLDYNPVITFFDPLRSGAIFNIGDDRFIRDQIKSIKNNPQFEVANYDYVIGSGKTRQTMKFGYIMIQLNRNLPHIVLDSKQNNKKIFGFSFSSLPISFDKSQVISLEGNFDSMFTLYAPKKYERDALYIFSPDLMTLFMDNSSAYDAEIIDDKLYLYSNKPFDMMDEALLKDIFNIIHTIGLKTSSKSKNYVDESVINRSDNYVSVSGRKLKSQYPWSVIIVISGFVIYQIILFFVIPLLDKQ